MFFFNAFENVPEIGRRLQAEMLNQVVAVNGRRQLRPGLQNRFVLPDAGHNESGKIGGSRIPAPGIAEKFRQTQQQDIGYGIRAFHAESDKFPVNDFSFLLLLE